ncbi:hypothetical protein SAMN02745216_01902 [Desulfatibacillum alkenivorans DSM 16219]|uniref:Uncharacterized protein n=1 Tax=Desulfatibacillum alkenivorans DSM 16219 TaxID=1121393 RepID=A0A1M6KHN4_9BACT|nr:hypothetical protein [Desulfatibacillum alkenivorans]SHJ58456.1 hypothetical protein SAMN02745216_01902 [Desulfatibacillum alkenivorans DSM 16219]
MKRLIRVFILLAFLFNAIIPCLSAKGAVADNLSEKNEPVLHKMSFQDLIELDWSMTLYEIQDAYPGGVLIENPKKEILSEYSSLANLEDIGIEADIFFMQNSEYLHGKMECNLPERIIFIEHEDAEKARETFQVLESMVVSRYRAKKFDNCFADPECGLKTEIQNAKGLNIKIIFRHDDQTGYTAIKMETLDLVNNEEFEEEAPQKWRYTITYEDGEVVEFKGEGELPLPETEGGRRVIKKQLWINPK